MFFIILIILMLIAGYYKTRKSTWPLNGVLCTCNRHKQRSPVAAKPIQPEESPRRSEKVEVDEISDGEENEGEKESEEEGSELLECKYLGNVSETSSDGDQDDQREGVVMDEEDEGEEQEAYKDGEVFVEVEKTEGILEDVEVLRIHHKSAGRSESWRSIKITSSVSNYKHHPRRRAKVR